MIISDALPVQLWPASQDTYNEYTPSGVHPVCWCQSFNCDDEIVISVDFEDFGGFVLNIYSESDVLLGQKSFTHLSGSVYYVSFTTESFSICDQRIKLTVTKSDVELLKSDCLDIKTSHDETVLFQYSNRRNFAGLNYDDVSPDLTYSIRIPARFYHEIEPEEDEAIELTSSVIITSAEVKTQRLLEVKHAPYYFHKKLRRVLKHQYLYADGKQWKKEEKYELNEGRRTWPLKSATCLLTEKNSVVRNVL